MDFAGLAIGVGAGVFAIVLVIILIYVFKDQIVNSTSLSLSNETINQINSFYGWVGITVVFFGLALMTAVGWFVIRMIRS